MLYLGILDSSINVLVVDYIIDGCINAILGHTSCLNIESRINVLISDYMLYLGIPHALLWLAA